MEADYAIRSFTILVRSCVEVLNSALLVIDKNSSSKTKREQGISEVVKKKLARSG